MKLLKNKTILKRMANDDYGYVKSSPKERILAMWEITAELWSLINKKNVERRLQRNIAKLVRQ